MPPRVVDPDPPPRHAAQRVGVRAWAKENGHSVNDRGRVPAEIREAYAKAH
ncbi:histone-like nucleoid-structuring protein Lsr2 [Streptomyces cinnamoneus]|uniref:Lsr2 family DNA-binding protein n=1 Tax=Streptomyces cinnamoneus TaxID=53446 RepID=UPI0023D8FE6C|nr:histone-like nucleoid-structuring protein Lsr2 [Streptomyces cinnamoneus]